MLIAHISDIHIAKPGQKTCGVARMAENLARCVDSINALKPRPDLVLLSGDISNGSSHAETAHAARILSALDCPLYLVPGNHDDRDVTRKVFGDKACPSCKDGFINYSIEGHPLRIIALDSVNPGLPGGQLCENRLVWLRACLTRGGDQPTVIFMHHPPLKLGVPETDADGFTGAEQLGRIVADFPNIERILCGHIHLTTHTRWRGSIVSTAPSIGMQLTLDLTQSAPSKFLLSDPAYLLHHWTPDRVLVTHVIQLAKLDGPFDFSAG
ncbi:MAG: phosphodiesterase [Alphaproteobacteria bacterium]|nr:phosphodiesterase [Alphaproteobacteria bacterium]